MTEPVRKTVTVPLSPKDTFDLFTTRIDTWWPKDSHSLAASRNLAGDSRVSVEPSIGGIVNETLPDGSVESWGTVTAWEPGKHLGLDWYVGGSPEDATQIDIRFIATEAGTRVDLTHSGFKATAMSASYDTGWDKVLRQCFTRAARGVVVLAH